MQGIVSPHYNIDQTILNRVIFYSWPKNEFRVLQGKKDVQTFYNQAYTFLESELEDILKKYHPAGIILEAYKQLEIWTAIHHKQHKKFHVKGPLELAPVGRYGWRYVIEKSLEQLKTKREFSELRPSAEDQCRIFTVLLGLSYSSELSNALQFLHSKASSVFIEFSPFLLQKHFNFQDRKERKLFEDIVKSLHNKTNWREYGQFGVDNPLLSKKINDFLVEYFGISVGDLEYFAITLVKLCEIINASIIVQPLNDFIDLVDEISALSRRQIEEIIELSFFKINKSGYETRDYLRKSQSIRMVNHGGIILELQHNLGAIYDPLNEKRELIKSSVYHIIVSPTLFADWIDVFIHRIAFGQRPDLKRKKEFKLPLSEIERVFRIEIFENEVKKLCINHGYKCISIDRIDRLNIPCGEIDLLAYHPKFKKLLIIECKNVSPSTDFKSCRQVYSDHFSQKNYHQKFLKKIEWVYLNLNLVEKEFLKKTGVTKMYVDEAEKIFVTASDYVGAFFTDEYQILTFDKFDFQLREYGKNRN